MTTTPAVAVVVPARDAGRTLGAAVRSALDQAGVGPLEVAVAVGASSDDTHEVAVALARADHRVHVVDNPEGTTPAALNHAIAATTAPVVVRLDAHALLPPGYIARAVSILAETGAGNVGGRQVPTASSGFAAAVALAMASPAGAGGADYRTGSHPGPTDTVYLGVFRRSALDAVGGFDARLLRNQDYELNYRLRRAGHQVWFDPELAVAYRPRGTVGGLARQYFDYGRWKRVVLREHPGSLRLRQLAAPVLVVSLMVCLALGPWSWVPAGVVATVYAVGLAAVATAASPRRAPGVAVALVLMHLCWGVGFLVGATGMDRR